MKTTRFYRMRLPHWEVDRNAYFVTLRLAGTLPREVERELRIQSEKLRSASVADRTRIHREAFRLLDKTLDNRNLRTLFSDSRLANICVEAICYRVQQGRWGNVEFVVMPNHLHIFFELQTGSLDSEMIDFKRWTAMSVQKAIPLGSGPVWQREWFDHWSRSTTEDRRIIEYIRDNPVKAGLVDDYLKWPYGSWNALSSEQRIAYEENGEK